MRGTDGSEVNFIDMCSCCQLDTGGSHQVGCPLYWHHNNVIAPSPTVVKRGYADFVAWKEKGGKWDFVTIGDDTFIRYGDREGGEDDPEICSKRRGVSSR